MMLNRANKFKILTNSRPSEPVQSTIQYQTTDSPKLASDFAFQNLHEQPVISRLISHHGVTVNITAALLSANARDDGWFDLEIQGKASQIRCLNLDELDLENLDPSPKKKAGKLYNKQSSGRPFLPCSPALF